MIFNFWRPYSFIKPKKDGWYSCTILYGENTTEEHRRVLDLYYIANIDQWMDARRQHVFDGYKVYQSCREPLESNRIYTDRLCERVDVVAWRKLPRICTWWK